MNDFVQGRQLCWNCKNATGGCSWADNLVPVKGWVAEWTNKETYNVQECPEFIRDAENYGLKRVRTI